MSYHAVSVTKHTAVHVHCCVQLCKSVVESVRELGWRGEGGTHQASHVAQITRRVGECGPPNKCDILLPKEGIFQGCI